jgi:hypothetical protein
VYVSKKATIAVHWNLCLACLDFIRSQWTKIKNELPGNQFQSLVSNLSHVVSAVLVIDQPVEGPTK